MSFFTSTHSILTETPLPASVDLKSAIALFHDHKTFQNLQPLVTEEKVIATPAPTSWLATEVTAVSPAATEPEYRSVTVAVPFGPFGSSSVTTKSAFIDTDDGLIIVFEAPMGLYGQNQWHVLAAEDGDGLLLREEAKLTGFALLMPFVIMTKKQSHIELASRFTRKLEENISSVGSSNTK